MDELGLLRFAIGGGFLAYAAVLDVKTRRVRNAVWLGLGSLALVLLAADFLVLRTATWIDLAVAAGFAAVVYGLWYVRMIAGGADAKALMALGVLLPRPIDWTWVDLHLPWLPSVLPGVVTVWANGALLLSFSVLIIATANLVRGHLAWPTMFLGRKMPLAQAERRHVWIVERVRDDGRVTHSLLPSRYSDEENAANIERLRARGADLVWVTWKMPAMVGFLAGFLLAFTVGDLLYTLVARLVVALTG